MSYAPSTLKKQQFFGYWRWIHIRECQKCNKKTRILGGDTRRPPDLPPGAIYCPHCDKGLLALG